MEATEIDREAVVDEHPQIVVTAERPVLYGMRQAYDEVMAVSINTVGITISLAGMATM